MLSEPAERAVDFIDHREFREREDINDRDVFLDGPTGLLGDDVLHCGEKGVEGIMEPIAFVIDEFGQANSGLDLEEVAEGRIYFGRVIGGGAKLDFFILAIVDEFHRDEEQRRLELMAFGVDPMEPAKSCEQHLNALFAIGQAGTVGQSTSAGEGFDGSNVGDRIREHRGRSCVR